jgi:hypothetical protein
MILRFPLVANPGLKLNHLYNYALQEKPFYNHQCEKGDLYMRVGPTTHLLLMSNTKHNTSNDNL